jgi:hypothetical protein
MFIFDGFSSKFQIPNHNSSSHRVIMLKTSTVHDLIINTINDRVIHSRSCDKFWNLTEICQANKKQFRHYNEATHKRNQEYMKLLREDVGGPILDVGTGRAASWGHPILAVHVAQWCSPAFCIQVSKLVQQGLVTIQPQNNHIEDEKSRKLTLFKAIPSEQRINWVARTHQEAARYKNNATQNLERTNVLRANQANAPKIIQAIEDVIVERKKVVSDQIPVIEHAKDTFIKMDSTVAERKRQLEEAIKQAQDAKVVWNEAVKKQEELIQNVAEAIVSKETKMASITEEESELRTLESIQTVLDSEAHMKMSEASAITQAVEYHEAASSSVSQRNEAISMISDFTLHRPTKRLKSSTNSNQITHSSDINTEHDQTN